MKFHTGWTMFIQHAAHDKFLTAEHLCSPATAQLWTQGILGSIRSHIGALHARILRGPQSVRAIGIIQTTCPLPLRLPLTVGVRQKVTQACPLAHSPDHREKATSICWQWALSKDGTGVFTLIYGCQQCPSRLLGNLICHHGIAPRICLSL